MWRNNSFVSRGGIWVLAQVPLMLLAFIVPIRFGAGQIIPLHPLAWLGALVTVAGGALIIWGFVSLGDALTPFPRPLDGVTLHRQGAFRLMRHPIYTGVILASLGWTLWWLCGIGMLPVLALAIFFDRKAAYEENWLREKYRDYGDYARRVKKFIPGVY
ncbi:Isoprenylcysteine carboxyl methyltransferase [Sulfuricaulis limicola]|uniref:Isoprenylcysteine carboxyl methyltransferase n=1 Tax=Sulfuricaulis limicola TaxID=1620215 RepID=A0A1B4XE98_9GAMM|nr:isoprenylcysteine carboxylmethyltransferase family protein [Sulfuricaulis limicola]BAV33137.1 Isoprenylcysteine carboxyl methyltransferase [Sulfuricaulis limicola]